MINARRNVAVDADARATPPRTHHPACAALMLMGHASIGRNDLLAALPQASFAALEAQLELLSLPEGKELFHHGAPLENAYFPISSIISLRHVTADGGATDIAMVGHEGVLGVSLCDGEAAICSAVVQSAGECYRLATPALRAAFNRGGALPLLLMRHANALFAQLAQNAVSARHGSIEQKLCRWLLDRLDRSPGNALQVTQELIAIMLGVRRESITTAAGKLQDDGLIRYHRGNITILDRQGLERQAGECYQIAKSEYLRLLHDGAPC